MRVFTPQITWHNRDPVLCVDFDPSSGLNKDEGSSDTKFYRLATGGSDSHVLIWHLRDPCTVKAEFTCVADLSRHSKAVNALRFSPCGQLLATADDDAYVYIWKNDTDKSTGNEEFWMVEKALRKHIDDVSDMSWSLDSTKLVTTSVDNSAIVWDIKKGVSLHILSEHVGFVQGASYDPLGEFVATISTDRMLRVFNSQTGKLSIKALKYPTKWLPREKKTTTDDSGPQNGDAKKSTPPPPCNRLFHDDTLKSYCRRLNFSPKGEFLVVPGGILPPPKRGDEPDKSPIDTETKNSKKMNNSKQKPLSDRNAVVVFCRNSLTNPCSIIPTGTSYSIAARFCPSYFQRNRDVIAYDKELVNPTKKSERLVTCVGKLKNSKRGKKSLLEMPYRLVFAVGTNDSVIISDTDSVAPLAVVRNIHLTRMSDLSWSADGRLLIVSSTDGYCSLVSFEENELGIPIEEEILPVPPQAFPIPPPIVKEKIPKLTKKRQSKDQSEKGDENGPKKPATPTTKSKKKPATPKTPPGKLIAKLCNGSFKHKRKIYDDSKLLGNDGPDVDVTIRPSILSELKPSSELTDADIENTKTQNNLDTIDKTIAAVAAEGVKTEGGTNNNDREGDKEQIAITPKRNTFLERWLKKNPGSKDSSASPVVTDTHTNGTNNVGSPAPSASSPLKATDDVMFIQPGISPSLRASSTKVLKPLISPIQIHQLQNSPIIVDLEAEEAENAASVILQSSDISNHKSGKGVEDSPTVSNTNGGLENIVTPVSRQVPPKLITLTPIREKRPATSPLSSQQKPKQPRRVQFVTLPKSPRKSD